MPITSLFYGDQISPGSQPVLVFPIVANQVNLISTYSGSGTLSGVEGSEVITESGTDTDIGSITNAPIAGQLSNLRVRFSQDGGAFGVGAGALAEIASGYYSYIPASAETNNPPTPNSSNTGTVVFRFFPNNPTVVANTYIEETVVVLRLRAPGTPLARLAPGQQQTVSELLQPIVNSINNFTQQAIRDLLGNQMTNKPTFRKDP